MYIHDIVCKLFMKIEHTYLMCVNLLYDIIALLQGHCIAKIGK